MNQNQGFDGVHPKKDDSRSEFTQTQQIQEVQLYGTPLKGSRWVKAKRWLIFLAILALLIYLWMLRVEQTKLSERLVEVEVDENKLKAKLESSDHKVVHLTSKLNMLKRKVIQNQPKEEIDNNKSIVPEILWLYTDFPFKSEKMYQQLQGNYLIKKAQQSGFEIRYVNKWSAYEWLSKQTQQQITKAIQNTPLEVSVRELLRIALLMEHGGVVVRLGQTFLTSQLFSSIFQHLKLSSDELFDPEVLLFAERIPNRLALEYQDYFIAAVKRAQLITNTFNHLVFTIKTGETNFQRLKQATYIDEYVNSTRVRDITRNIFQSLLEEKSSDQYLVTVIETDLSYFSRAECQNQLVSLLKQSSQVYNDACGQPNHFIHFSREIRQKIEDQLESQIDNQKLGADQKGYWFKWMTISQNRKLFEPSPPRKIQYCLLDVHPGNDLSLIKSSLERLKKQSFKSWTAVYFIEKPDSQGQSFVEEQKKLGYDIKLVVTTGNKGRNYEVGIIHHCPNKSFVVVLRREENIEDEKSLQLLSSEIAPRDVLGALVGVRVSGISNFAASAFQWYQKAIHNSVNPAFNVLNDILNFLRVFHSDCYKIIPQFELRTPEGRYFQNRFNFLEHFIFMVKTSKARHDVPWQIEHVERVKWFVKSNQEIFDVPFRIARSTQLVITTEKYEQVDPEELKLSFYKQQSCPMVINLDHFLQNGIPMQELAVFNPGLKYEPYSIRKKPDIIPKKIHLIWIEGKMPPGKQKIIEMNKQLYPDYQWRIWTFNDITRQNFPYSYDMLMNLYNMEHKSRFGKRASMADMMRHELMYYHGGFYMDSSMFLFSNVFNKWLSYKIVLSAERTFRHRWGQSMCIFGTIPKHPSWLRIISPNNMNQYNLWLRDALEIAGPNNFRWLVRGFQQYDPDNLIMGYDAFYPLAYYLDNHYQTYCFCESKFHQSDDQIVYSQKGLDMLGNCSKYYPYSYGREAYLLGGSWVWPKW